MKLSSLQFALTINDQPVTESQLDTFFFAMGWKVRELEQVDESVWIADLPLSPDVSIEMTLVNGDGDEFKFAIDQP